jgi:hypothetical protein
MASAITRLEGSLLALQRFISVAETAGWNGSDLAAFMHRRRYVAEVTRAADQQAAPKKRRASTYVNLLHSDTGKVMSVVHDSDEPPRAS